MQSFMLLTQSDQLSQSIRLSCWTICRWDEGKTKHSAVSFFFFSRACTNCNSDFSFWIDTPHTFFFILWTEFFSLWVNSYSVLAMWQLVWWLYMLTDILYLFLWKLLSWSIYVWTLLCSLSKLLSLLILSLSIIYLTYPVFDQLFGLCVYSY